MLIGMQSLFPTLIGDTGGSEGDPGAGGEPGAGGQPQGQQPNGTTDPGAGGEGGWKPPASQAEFDRIITDRAKRAEEAGVRKLLEASGATSPDELTTAYKAKQEADELSKSEQQKLQDRIAKLEADNKAKDDARASAEGQVAEMKRQQQFAAAAAKAGIPADRIADAYTLSTFPDGDQEPDFDKVVKATVEAKPWLADTNGQTKSHGAAGRSASGLETKDSGPKDRLSRWGFGTQ